MDAEVLIPSTAGSLSLGMQVLIWVIVWQLPSAAGSSLTQGLPLFPWTTQIQSLFNK